MTEAKPNEKNAITISGVSHDYPGVRAIDGMDLVVGAREVVGIVGASGCGKSTLLKMVCGLLDPSQGVIRVGDHDDPEGRLESCAFMPQRDLLLPWLSAIDNAGLAPRFTGLGKVRSRQLAADTFERFGLGGFEGSLPGELSGGMRQRVALLRTLISDRPVLCLDEPFSALDAISRADLQSWFGSILNEIPRTCLLVTHDVEESLYLCDRTVVLSPRPGHVVCEIDSPAPRAADRLAAICSPEFVQAKQRALEALGAERAVA
jgi:ABC-type nitrate/sulfonate/bicarbonate transport system ATPase subunit